MFHVECGEEFESMTPSSGPTREGPWVVVQPQASPVMWGQGGADSRVPDCFLAKKIKPNQTERQSYEAWSI